MTFDDKLGVFRSRLDHLETIQRLLTDGAKLQFATEMKLATASKLLAAYRATMPDTLSEKAETALDKMVDDLNRMLRAHGKIARTLLHMVKHMPTPELSKPELAFRDASDRAVDRRLTRFREKTVLIHGQVGAYIRDVERCCARVERFVKVHR